MPEPATVYITNMAADHSYESASHFGAVRPVTSGNYPVFKTARLIEEISAALAHSTEEDYLLFSGSSLVAGLCLTVWLMSHKECKALLYDRAQKGYVPRVLKRSDIQIQLEKAKDKLEEK